MKLIISGVTFSAAQARSPSFSRSSSSTMTMSRPERNSSMASLIVASGIACPQQTERVSQIPLKALLGQIVDGELAAFTGWLLLVLQQPFDVFGKDVNFKINMVSRLIITDNRVLPGMRNDGDLERLSVDHCGYGQADPVDRDRSLHCYVFSKLAREFDPDAISFALGFYGQALAGAVDVALHHVPAEPLAYRQGTFEIDQAAWAEAAETGSPQCLERSLGAERVRA